ncbi:hypothetical protein QWZ13_10235 [Reinekea marina]|nr:hypothetical protein [Reinekea marina]MDN3649291.1 hypothetical protein [Reinekea marina]
MANKPSPGEPVAKFKAIMALQTTTNRTSSPKKALNLRAILPFMIR